MAVKSKKRLSIFNVLKELIIMRIQTLGVGFLPAVFISLVRGLLFGLGVSSMQILFDSIEATLNAPEKGLSLIISAVARMAAIIIGEQVLNSADFFYEAVTVVTC